MTLKPLDRSALVLETEMLSLLAGKPPLAPGTVTSSVFGTALGRALAGLYCPNAVLESVPKATTPPDRVMLEPASMGVPVGSSSLSDVNRVMDALALVSKHFSRRLENGSLGMVCVPV